MTDIILWFTTNGTWLLESIAMIVGGAAVIATQTPNKADDNILQMILDLINFLGGNIGKAKNAE